MNLKPVVLELDLETIKCKLAECKIGRRQDVTTQSCRHICCPCVRQ